MARFSVNALIALLSSSPGCFAALLTTSNQAVNGSYDFIVIGAGAAGSVIAHRLTESPDVRVLLIEAGGSNVGAPDVDELQIPYFVSSVKPQFDWNYTTVPQRALVERTIQYPRGHVLGGSTSTNFMFYTRGSSDEFDRLARVSGDDGWSWNKMLPYLLKTETLSAPADGHNTTGQVDPGVHGTSGPLLTSLPGNASVLDSRVIETTSQLPEFPFNVDMNSGNPLGVGWLQSTIGRGLRSSAATAFLSSDALSRPNLDVLISTRVTKLFSTQSEDGIPTFLGVELAQSTSDSRVQLTARKEVVLSAGAIGTPQLLMLSGIGDHLELSRHGIRTLVHAPDVGKHLQDHPWVPLQWAINTENTLDPLNRNSTLVSDELTLYEKTKMGPLANNPAGNQIGWFRLPANSSVLARFGDPTAGPLSPHFELTFGNSFLSFTQPTPATGNFMSMCIVLVSPVSRGSVKLASSSPFDAPLIDPAFLQAEADVAILVEGVKAAHLFASAPAWNSFIAAPFPEAANTTTDEDIIRYITAQVNTFRHPMGTARMASAAGPAGVVGPNLLVKKVHGLRVVDASVFPHIFGAHLQAPVYAIAERASDLIKQQHGIVAAP